MYEAIKLSNKHVQVLQPPQYINVTNLNFDFKLEIICK